MTGIVFEHSASMWGLRYTSSSDTWIQIASMLFFKFATIAFFLIGGFLINYKFTEYTPLEYIKRRFKKTISPWLFWIGVLIAANVVQKIVVYYKRGSILFEEGAVTYFLEQLRYIFFESSFWFVLNFLICICILLIFFDYLFLLFIAQTCSLNGF